VARSQARDQRWFMMIGKKNLKGQLEISFNWIFILIAGAAILFFFITIITKEKNDTQTQIDLRVAQNLEKVLSVIRQNTASVQVLDAFNSDAEFRCEGNDYSLGLGDGSTSSTLESDIIFAPQSIGDGAKLIAWTQNIDMPYTVASGLYLSDERVMYIFLYDGLQSTVDLYNGFPEQFTKKLLYLDDPNPTPGQSLLRDYTDAGFKKYVVVGRKDFLYTSIIDPSVRKKASVVIFDPDGGVDQGTVGFYENPSGRSNEQPDATEVYVSREMLYGAIISGNDELYKCSQDKVMEKFRIVSQVVNYTLQELKDEYEIWQPCRVYYNDIFTVEEIGKMIEYSKDIGNNLQLFVDSRDKIEDYNREILSTSCPLIY